MTAPAIAKPNATVSIGLISPTNCTALVRLPSTSDATAELNSFLPSGYEQNLSNR